MGWQWAIRHIASSWRRSVRLQVRDLSRDFVIKDAHSSRQHWAFLRCPFPALHQSVVSERQQGPERKVPSRLDIRAEGWRVGHVRKLGRLRCCQYEDNGQSSEWRLGAQRRQNVDHKCGLALLQI